MTLFLDENCVAELVGMDDALAAVEEVFGEVGRGSVTNVPRVRAPLKDGTLRITAAVLNYRGYYGVKVSSTTIFESSAGRVFSLYKADTGELAAIVQVFAMGALRTGAASGVATKFMARPDACRLGVVGTGRQARTQVEAICKVRPIREILVHSRSAENRARFCAGLAGLDIQATPVDSAEAAIRDRDIVVTATTATEPVLWGAWLAPGTHVNAIGANYEYRRETDSDAIGRTAIIATDDLEQVKYEATDLTAPVAEGVIGWDRVVGLGDIVAGNTVGRRSDQDITLFKSLGVALEDVALAACAYEKALEAGIGQKLPDLAG
ncbi:MAG: ornithine cyclodeaminase family protein [Rhodospirillaceae bacterium]|jgi:alanine dehydrogenase|nr:ornithine cyclodeaminase family protein [Rhodospirillaceae bacterium]MBT5049145.1 ornithine cyclodeaminase family protein [Rhodospirillaceae bacterium]MBT5455274.1 ornithine cyclodeaminase family protein [Rhodospirillaceae bacterium]